MAQAAAARTPGAIAVSSPPLLTLTCDDGDCETIRPPPLMWPGDDCVCTSVAWTAMSSAPCKVMKN